MTTLYDLARKEQQKKFRKQFARKIAAIGIAASIAQLFLAQLVDWGLACYRIRSGIWGPWFLMEAFTSLIAVSVTIGMMRAVKEMSELNR
jgi:hypothetical protein